MTAIYECEQCDGTGTLRGGSRCPCREEDAAAEKLRSRMGVVPRRDAVGTIPTAPIAEG